MVSGRKRRQECRRRYRDGPALSIDGNSPPTVRVKANTRGIRRAGSPFPPDYDDRGRRSGGDTSVLPRLPLTEPVHFICWRLSPRDNSILISRIETRSKICELTEIGSADQPTC